MTTTLPAPVRAAHLALLALLSAACAATDGPASQASAGARPAWIDEPYQVLARREQIAGVGVANGTHGRARDTAEKRALDAINASITVAVRSEIELRTRSLSDNGDVDWSEDVDETIRLSSSGELPGAEVVERWTDAAAGETWVLVGVRRELLLDEILPEVEQSLAAADSYLAVPRDDPAAHMTALLNAHGLLAPAVARAGRAHVIAQGSREEARTRSLFGRCTGHLESIHRQLASLSASITIEALGGNGQAGVLDGALERPLRARFLHLRQDGRRVPLAGLPVSFAAVDGPGTAIVQERATTDGDGVIEARVTSLAPTGRAENRILVGPDVARLSASLPAGRVPRLSFVYSLPTPAQTALLVVIEQRHDERPVRLQSLGHALGDHLAGFGFDVEVLAPDSPTGRAVLRADADALDLRHDVVLRGRATSWVSHEERETYFFRAVAELDVIDLRGGGLSALATEDGRARAASGDRGEGGAAAVFRALVPELERVVDAGFVSRYLPSAAPDAD